MDSYKFDLLKRGIEGDLRGYDLTPDQAKELHDSITEIIKQSVAIPDSGIIFSPYVPVIITKIPTGNVGNTGIEQDDPNELFSQEDYQKEEEDITLTPKTKKLNKSMIDKWSGILEQESRYRLPPPKKHVDDSEEYPF